MEENTVGCILPELDRLRFQVLNARHRAVMMERENLILQFLSNNIAAQQLTRQLHSLAAERAALMARWCEERQLPVAEYTIDEETGNFVKVSP